MDNIQVANTGKLMDVPGRKQILPADIWEVLCGAFYSSITINKAFDIPELYLINLQVLLYWTFVGYPEWQLYISNIYGGIHA